MPRDLRFWRNVILIGAAHVVVLVGLARWGGMKKPPKRDIVWMAAAAGAVDLAEATPEPVEEEPPPAEETPVAPPNESATPAMTPVESDIPLPTPTASSTPAPTPSATPKPKPTATPKATATPKPKKSKTKKATPKPTPKATPKKSKQKKETPKPSAPTAKKAATSKKEKTAAPSDTKKEGSGGTANDGRGTAKASDSNWYGNMLHDRFFGAWIQPKTTSATGSKMAAVVQARIEKDGRVASFKIVRSSGNVVVDESIAAVGARVLKVDPLPAGLAEGGHYDIRINFELDVN